MAIRQAGLEPLALSAPATSEWSTVGRRRAGRNGLSCPKQLPGSVIYCIETDRSSRSGSVRSLTIRRSIGARQGSFGHALATGKDRWRCRRASRRRHREAQAGTPNLLSIPDNGVWLNLPWLNLLSADLLAGWG